MRSRSRAWIAALAAAACAACGASQGRLEGGTYTDGRLRFRVGAVPADWRAIQVEGATLAYRDDPRRASVLLSAHCGNKDEDTPLASLTQQLLIGTTGREVTSEETIPFDAREALHTRLAAKLDGVPMAYDIFVLKKDGCVYDFVYVAEPDTITAGAPIFDAFVATFHTSPGAS